MKEYRYVIKLGSDILHKINFLKQSNYTRCGKDIMIYDSQYFALQKSKNLCKKCFKGALK